MTREALIQRLEDERSDILDNVIERNGMCIDFQDTLWMERAKRIISILRRIRVCPKCKGSGTWGWQNSLDCPRCNGKGILGGER